MKDLLECEAKRPTLGTLDPQEKTSKVCRVMSYRLLIQKIVPQRYHKLNGIGEATLRFGKLLEKDLDLSGL